MSNKEPLLIGTASVVVIALSLSLISIYVLPNYYYQIHVYRNTDLPLKLEILRTAENLGINSSCFSSLNFTEIVNAGGWPVINITNAIMWAEGIKKYNEILIQIEAEEKLDNVVPKKIRLTYNGTIIGSKSDYISYLNYINTTFFNSDTIDATYLAFLNNSNYVAYSNFLNESSKKFSYSTILHALNVTFSQQSKPDFVIYQHFDLFVNYGLFQDYKTSFTRLVFIDVFNRVLFFLSTEGNWDLPLLTV